MAGLMALPAMTAGHAGIAQCLPPPVFQSLIQNSARSAGAVNGNKADKASAFRRCCACQGKGWRHCHGLRLSARVRSRRLLP